jgi:hypothetical protein
MTFILIMLVQYLFSNTMKNAGTTAYDATLKSLGYGLLFWIGVPVAAAVALLSVVGVPIGLILLLCYVALLLTASVVTAVVTANWLNNRAMSYWDYWRMVFAAFGIFVILKVLTFTPFLGWFIYAVLVCISFGAVILNIKWRRRIQSGNHEVA